MESPPRLIRRYKSVVAGRKASRRLAHADSSESVALVFMLKLHGQGFDVDLDDGDRCLERMRFAAKTGRYPIERLNAKKS